MEIAPVPGIRALRPVSGRPTLVEMHAPPAVEAAGRMEDDSYAGGRSGEHAWEEEHAQRLEKDVRNEAAKARMRRTDAGYGEPYHRVDLFV